ncbi:CEP95 protein, partial [Alcedo cyanopectus]|nr:CEP95 protein [Ceyx cyanopectus]
ICFASYLDWVEVANDLLRSCHINQHIKHLCECGADVFVPLYESILGEKVPDFIATPRSQEDDAHNVQAVIDSLALDYLQVSLSHITGENIVKGEKDSIRNLLEIFDGLLEYLTEEVNESCQNGDEVNVLPRNEIQTASQEQLESKSNAGELPEPSLSLSLGGSQGEFIVPSWSAEESDSTSELIRLGDTAYSFSKRKEGSLESVHTIDPEEEALSGSATKLGEPIQQAIPLLPPFQPAEARPCYPEWRDYQSLARQAAALPNTQGVKIPPVSTVQPLPPTNTYLVSASAVEDQRESNDAEEDVAKVPWVYGTSSASSVHQKLSLHTEQITQIPRPESRYLPGKKRQVLVFGSITDSLEEALSPGTTKANLFQPELHQVSERLSRRLNELDLMLQRALSGHSREELADEDKLSQHSDSVMECRRGRPRPDTPRPKYPSRPRSLSPSSPSSQHQHFSEVEDELCSNGTGQIRTIHSQLQKEKDGRTKKTKMVAKAYEDELRNYEAKERLRLSELRGTIKEVEHGYKENIFEEPSKMPQPVKVYSRKTTPRNPKHSQWIPKRGPVKPKKAAPMKVRDDDLLLQLLEEFPHLHISHHTMKKMWQQQLALTQQLKGASGRTRPKLQNEVQQALKKHELLLAIIKKDQDHKKRLQEFQQGLSRQQGALRRLRERRQQAARARSYYEDYRGQLRARMLRARTREERIFKNLFEEGLEIQKQRLKDLRAYAQEKRAEQRREHQNELESMENYYKDQFSMLAEALSQEHKEIKTREKAQAQMLQKAKRDLRSRMEKEIQQLQAAIMQSDDDTFFRELEAERLKSRLQMASFQYSKSQFL